MIKTFKNKATEKIANGENSRKFPADIQTRSKMRLERINAAEHVNDLRVPPSHRLEKLTGDRTGQYSIRINDQFRVCFVWNDGHAYDVEIIDYH